MGWLERKFGIPDRVLLGPEKPRPPQPDLHFPPGAYIRDYKEYDIKISKELLETQQRLAARGLKSPWLRNAVWRYDPKIWGTYKFRVWDFWTFGWKYAIPLTIVSVFYDFAIKKEFHLPLRWEKYDRPRH